MCVLYCLDKMINFSHSPLKSNERNHTHTRANNNLISCLDVFFVLTIFGMVSISNISHHDFPLSIWSSLSSPSPSPLPSLSPLHLLLVCSFRVIRFIRLGFSFILMHAFIIYRRHRIKCELLGSIHL